MFRQHNNYNNNNEDQKDDDHNQGDDDDDVDDDCVNVDVVVKSTASRPSSENTETITTKVSPNDNDKRNRIFVI